MSKKATRDAFGDTLRDIATEDNAVFAMDCDLGGSTRAAKIMEADPSRFIEMGIAEQDMVSTAAGMASMGKVVFVNSFAVFLTGRAYDQIRQQVALPRSNVKLCASSSGLTQGADGATHQSVTDINLMRGLPHMVVLSPADAVQTDAVIRFAHTYKGPVYIRLSRYATQQIFPDDYVFEFNQIETLSQGTDVALIATGPILEQVLAARKLLEAKGYSCGVYHVPTIKPFDADSLKAIANQVRLLATIEEHSIIGGLGSATAEVLSSLATHPPLVRIGVQDCFGESGSAEELLCKHKLDAEGIVERITSELQH
ncbi:MAG: transketolase family protein [Sphaerochaetaceae bacterium]|nr:transketolase family protein [Sphaerochaetaceae bacterium]